MSEAKQETFTLGDAVVIEMGYAEGTRKICGILYGGNDEEFYIKVTHKESEIPLAIGDATRKKIAERLKGRTTLDLKRELVRRTDLKMGVLATRAEALEELQMIHEADMLEEHKQGVQMYENIVPVSTIISRDYVVSIESVDDRAFGIEVAEFGDTAAEGFEDMLKELDEKKEEDEGTEEEGAGTESG